MVARGLLSLALGVLWNLTLFGQEALGEYAIVPVAKFQILQEDEHSFLPLEEIIGEPVKKGFHFRYQIIGKDILGLKNVELETLIGPDGKNQAQNWNDVYGLDTFGVGLTRKVESGVPAFLFTVRCPEGEFGKIDFYRFKGVAKVLVGLKLARETVVVQADGVETNTEAGFCLKLKGKPKGLSAKDGLARILDPESYIFDGKNSRQTDLSTTLILGSSGPIIRSIQENGRKFTDLNLPVGFSYEKSLTIPETKEAKRIFVIEYWMETKEIAIPFQS